MAVERNPWMWVGVPPRNRAEPTFAQPKDTEKNPKKAKEQISPHAKVSKKFFVCRSFIFLAPLNRWFQTAPGGCSGVFKDQKFSEAQGTLDGRNPQQPPEMDKTL